jgi:hypothetical protein
MRERILKQARCTISAVSVLAAKRLAVQAQRRLAAANSQQRRAQQLRCSIDAAHLRLQGGESDHTGSSMLAAAHQVRNALLTGDTEAILAQRDSSAKALWQSAAFKVSLSSTLSRADAQEPD